MIRPLQVVIAFSLVRYQVPRVAAILRQVLGIQFQRQIAYFATALLDLQKIYVPTDIDF